MNPQSVDNPRDNPRYMSGRAALYVGSYLCHMSGRDLRYMSGLLLRLPMDYQPTTNPHGALLRYRYARERVDNGLAEG